MRPRRRSRERRRVGGDPRRHRDDPCLLRDVGQGAAGRGYRELQHGRGGGRLESERRTRATGTAGHAARLATPAPPGFRVSPSPTASPRSLQKISSSAASSRSSLSFGREGFCRQLGVGVHDRRQPASGRRRELSDWRRLLGLEVGADKTYKGVKMFVFSMRRRAEEEGVSRRPLPTPLLRGSLGAPTLCGAGLSRALARGPRRRRAAPRGLMPRPRVSRTSQGSARARGRP